MITLNSKLFGTINAQVEKVITTQPYGAVLVSAEVEGERLLGVVSPDASQVSFGNRQNFYKIAGFNNAKYQRVIRALRPKLDKESADNAAWSFQIKVAEGKDELLLLLSTIEETPAKRKQTATPVVMSEEDQEFFDDQYGHLLLGQPILDDSGIDNIEETPRAGAN